MSYSEQVHYLITKLKEMHVETGKIPTEKEFKKKFPNINVQVLFGSFDGFLRIAGLKEEEEKKLKHRQPRILVFDIETKPLIAYCWGLFDQNIGLDMVIEDWSVLSWAAKWVGNDKVMYQDLSMSSDYTKDEILICGIHELLCQADVVITQNGIKFDEKKLNGKFEKYKLGAPSPFRHIDALKIKRKKFGLTSNKLEYSTNYFNEKYKKLKHSKFAGFSLWKECLNGNQEAWAEMKLYNIHDVLALEEEYLNSLIRWDSTINYGVYTGAGNSCPNCGSTELQEKEFSYTKTGAFQVFQCVKCKSFSQSRHNELPKALTKNLLK